MALLFIYSFFSTFKVAFNLFATAACVSSKFSLMGMQAIPVQGEANKIKHMHRFQSFRMRRLSGQLVSLRKTLGEQSVG
jgi:hypothetical protein